MWGLELLPTSSALPFRNPSSWSKVVLPDELTCTAVPLFGFSMTNETETQPTRGAPLFVPN